ncbi:shikimate kinase [Klebsiella pneumoniae]|uniref:shikimate kinase n=1 Tax=Klebsiella pneumoniae TaxID=573 RepID=UPI001645150E|nr:shikimate kinase [Klebsiella pneumoniae]HDT4054598.1 shikimate kinase [Klebsiella pneumoniae subsp. pneumoniae]MBC4367637.1 shikimate kinase [Klebsiella pneumoniae]MCQ0804384.1 shikimate kinase [Klebsiella pneumoniae]WBU70815.1 shikimate kinase [Klebsiella pneumoniae]HBQ3113324.1 shikimate kinase [Klebsiella pneumoniae]
MPYCVFLTGPGGAGKSTAGRIISDILGCAVIDLDDEFCERIQNIREFIHCKGYESYLEQNCALLRELLAENCQHDSLFILSSGFLSTDIRRDIVESNKKLVREKGVSVLLMPSRNYEEALACIIDRQLNRGFSLVREKEEKKFFQRFHEYLDTGDLNIFSMAEPEYIAKKIVSELSKTDFLQRG